MKTNPDLFTIVQKRFYDFFYRDVTDFHEVYHSPPRFPSLNIIKNAEARPAPMFDVIIE